MERQDGLQIEGLARVDRNDHSQSGTKGIVQMDQEGCVVALVILERAGIFMAGRWERRPVSFQYP